MNFFKRLCKRLFPKIYLRKQFAKIDKTVTLPKSLEISNPSNIYLEEYVNIGNHATLYATNASIKIGKYFISGPGLKIATGNHERRVGRFCASITESEKNHNLNLDKEVIIHEDVWAGFNVVILAGAEVSRGCTIAAGSVVSGYCPPYSICGGIPARFIKFYWTIEQIIEHESQLYDISERMSRTSLEIIFNRYK